MNIKLSRDLEGKGRKDYGFITYFKEEDAARAIKEFNWKNYFKYPLHIQYARKISSIIKHKQKIQGDMLERKRRRDNVMRKQIKYKNSDPDGSPISGNNKILNVNNFYVNSRILQIY
jgi:RNA recognition motif-containing protein